MTPRSSIFRKCSSLLNDGGALAMQAITIADQHYAAALKRVDFIKRYVFPGSFIPSVRIREAFACSLSGRNRSIVARGQGGRTA